MLIYEAKKQVEDWLQKRFEDGQHDKGSYYPSQMGNDCLRFLYYYFNNYESDVPMPVRINRIFDNGTDYHNRMRKYFKESGILLKKVRRFKDKKHNIHGEIDEYIKLGNTDILVELKSINTKQFTVFLKEPQKKHLYQIQIYLHYKKMKWGMVWYENKDNQEWKIFLVKYDKKYVEEVWKKIDILKKCGNIIPNKGFTYSDWNCGYCNYKFTCWGTDIWKTYYAALIKNCKSKVRRKKIEYLLKGVYDYEKENNNE